ncbi:MAG: LysE family transporter [Armatimonadetes bacterium]|nr:LysE family transporter [Armatimonadota bacterium]
MSRIAVVAFAIALTGAVTPGPLLALVVGQVLAQGPLAAPFILLGHALLEVVLVVVLAYGVGRFLQKGRVRGAVGLIGGAVLVWMGEEVVRHATAVGVEAAKAQPLSWAVLVAAGAGVSLSNPYFTGWWATVGTGQLAALRPRRFGEWLAFFLGHEMGDVVWYMAVAAALSLGASWIAGRAYQLLVGSCGAAMLLIGLWFLYTGGRFLMLRSDTQPDSGAEDEVRERGQPQG